MKRLYLAPWAALALALAAPLAAAAGDTAAPGDSVMTIRPGDAIDTELMGYHDTGGTWIVDADGNYQLPVFPKLHVAGLTDDQAADKIREAVGTLYKSQPAVSVRVTHRVSVLGQVRSPGLYQIDGSERVADVIAKAGGMTDQASLRGVRVASEDGTRRKNLSDDLHSGRTLREIGLRSGDVIYVPARHGLSDWRNWATVASMMASLALVYDIAHRN